MYSHKPIAKDTTPMDWSVCACGGEGARGEGERWVECLLHCNIPQPTQLTAPPTFLLELTQNATLKIIRPHLVILSPALLHSNRPCRAMILGYHTCAVQPALVHTQFSPLLPDTHDSFNNAVSASGDGHFREQVTNIRGSRRNPSSGKLICLYCEATSHRNLASANSWNDLMACLHIQRKIALFACVSPAATCMVAHARDTPLYGYFPSTTAFLRVLSVFCVAMWLTALLLGARWTPGKQWIGKHRRVLKMTATRRRNQAEREAQIKRVGRSRQSSYTRRCVPGYLPFRACVILHGLVSYISPAEGFATSIKIKTPIYRGQRTEWQPRLLVLQTDWRLAFLFIVFWSRSQILLQTSPSS